jgi:hypothetical protein
MTPPSIEKLSRGQMSKDRNRRELLSSEPWGQYNTKYVVKKHTMANRQEPRCKCICRCICICRYKCICTCTCICICMWKPRGEQRKTWSNALLLFPKRSSRKNKQKASPRGTLELASEHAPLPSFFLSVFLFYDLLVLDRGHGFDPHARPCFVVLATCSKRLCGWVPICTHNVRYKSNRVFSSSPRLKTVDNLPSPQTLLDCDFVDLLPLLLALLLKYIMSMPPHDRLDLTVEQKRLFAWLKSR